MFCFLCICYYLLRWCRSLPSPFPSFFTCTETLAMSRQMSRGKVTHKRRWKGSERLLSKRHRWMHTFFYHYFLSQDVCVCVCFLCIRHCLLLWCRSLLAPYITTKPQPKTFAFLWQMSWGSFRIKDQGSERLRSKGHRRMHKAGTQASPSSRAAFALSKVTHVDLEGEREGRLHLLPFCLYFLCEDFRMCVCMCVSAFCVSVIVSYSVVARFLAPGQLPPRALHWESRKRKV